MKLTILKTILVSLITMAATSAHAAKLYKWVDANGNISYQDQPPPKTGKILSEKEVVLKNDSAQQENQNLPEVVIYTVSNCTLCDRLVWVLKENKVPHIELALEDDRDAQKKILAKSNSIIAPSIFIGENILQGGSEENLKEQLRSVGYTLTKDQQADPSNQLTVD
ncbi:MAG: glutaredoxin [Arenicella sp.]|jgi:glutaredoxin